MVRWVEERSDENPPARRWAIVAALLNPPYRSLPTADNGLNRAGWEPTGQPNVAPPGVILKLRLVVPIRHLEAVRQPLRRAYLLHPGVELTEDVRAEIADELNVKALEEVTSLAELMTWRVVPNFRALGPRLGPRVNDVKAALVEADGSELRRALDADGWVEVAGER